MESENLYPLSKRYLQKLCVEIPERCVGSQGNRAATRFFEEITAGYGWETGRQPFEALDWENDGASLQAGGRSFPVLVSPYAPGCAAQAELASASSLAELESLDVQGKILLLHGEIAKEPLMPKNFVFYNPDEHKRTIALLEAKEPAAILSATGRSAATAGGVYPFPLIEDGDFDIPSVYMTEEEGQKLLAFTGKTVTLNSISRRIPGNGWNALARKGTDPNGRIVVTAHIDAKKGTPGALDNASGVVVLLLLARLLEGYAGPRVIELVAFNGEDYYAVPGQMAYIRANQDRFDEILLNINIDGAGYREGRSAFSFFDLPETIREKASRVVDEFEGIAEGVQWVQGDHSIFIQYGRPAIAVTSQWFLENMNSQEITHTPKDRIEIVDCHKLVEIAEGLAALILSLQEASEFKTQAGQTG